MNSAQNFQSGVEPCFRTISKAVKAWIDDLAVHAKTEDDILHYLEKFFQICRDKNLKVYAKKRVIYNDNPKWCG